VRELRAKLRVAKGDDSGLDALTGDSIASESPFLQYEGEEGGASKRAPSPSKSRFSAISAYSASLCADAGLDS
jgi:hypothetical protein